MIPLNITIKNFLSYGPNPQKITFYPHRLICMVGRNGNGKSAILDALSWCIWGQARKTSNTTKPDAGLLHLGQEYMYVTSELLVNRKTYRIRREYFGAYDRPYSRLDFSIYDATTSDFIPLTEKTMRETQQKINQTLRLDFDTFTNSSMLRQGRSDEFSKKSPRERKEILCRILALDRYENIRKEALVRAKELQSKADQLEAVKRNLEESLENKEEVITEIKVVNRDLEVLEQSKEKTELERKDLEGRLHLVDYELANLEKEEAQLSTLKSHIKAKTQAVIETYRLWKKIHSDHLQLDRQDLSARITKLSEEVRQQQADINTKLQTEQELLNLQKRRNALEAALMDEINAALLDNRTDKRRLESEVENLQKQLKALRNRQLQIESNSKENSIKKEQIKRELKKAEEKNVAVRQLDKKREKYLRFRPTFLARLSETQLKLDATGKNKKLLDSDGSAACPLCRQALSTSKRVGLLEEINSRWYKLYRRAGRLTTLVGSIDSELRCIEEEHQNIVYQGPDKEILLERLQHLESLEKESGAERQNLEEQISEAETAHHRLVGQQLPAVMAAIAKLEDKLKKLGEQNSEIIALKKAIAELEKVTAALEETTRNADQKLKELQALRKLEEEANKAAAEVIYQQGRKDKIHNQIIEIKALKGTTRKLEVDIREGKPRLQNERFKLVSNLCSMENDLRKLRKDREKLIVVLGSHRQRLQQISRNTQKISSCAKSLSEILTSRNDYIEIAMAMGKDGVQSLIIEESLPEIEDETNRILGSLTKNQLYVTIESLRDLKSGKTKETLDINIADSKGIRPYDMFSGGEAFKIDFALRIAISRLLARRSGASLETLIIDEGFGSQDEEGLESVLAAIEGIKEYFAMVIVVSHLPAMVEQFDTHLRVTKGPTGSQAELVTPA